MAGKIKSFSHYILLISISTGMMFLEIWLIWPDWKLFKNILLLASSMSGLILLNMYILMWIFGVIFLKRKGTVNLILVIAAEIVIFIPPAIEYLTNFMWGFLSSFVCMFLIKILVTRGKFTPVN